MIEKLIESVKVKPICLQRRWSCSCSAAELQSDRKMPVDTLALLRLPLQSHCVQCNNKLLPPSQPTITGFVSLSHQSQPEYETLKLNLTIQIS